MEIDRQQAYIDAYRREAHNALQRFVEGERDETFLLRALELVGTYLHIPRRATSPMPADFDIVQLAQAIHVPLAHRGFLRQILALWPQLIQLAEQLSSPLIHAELVKQLAIIQNRQENRATATHLYRGLVGSTHFTQLTVEIQADVLQQAGTTLVWQGKLTQAATLLRQVLTLAEQHPIDQSHRNRVDQYGVRSNLEITPLWESKAYALNQLGNIAMFQGRFAQAEQLYNTSWQTINEHDEADNLACVSHQALGRLWMHWQRPKQAIPILEKGVVIRRRRQDREGLAINLLYLAAAHIQQRELAQAERRLNEALAIMRALDNRRDTGLCHLYFGQLELYHGRRKAALEQWQQALTYLQTAHTPLIEQRVFLSYSPWLLAIGEVGMVRAVTHQLYKSLRQQELRALDLGRILVRLTEARVGSLLPHQA